MRYVTAALIVASLFSVAPLSQATVALADTVKTEKVRFKSGATNAVIKGSIKGRDTMHYLLGVAAGQSMRVKLNTKSTSTYFNVFAPGKVPGQDAAMFIGDTGGDTFEGMLPASGDYLIQVYLYRSAARRNESAQFTLDVAIAAEATGDVLVPDTNFNATGDLPCARSAGQPMQTCKFGVVRRADGGGDVTVFWPDGGNRVIFFEKGAPSGFDQAEADGGAKMKASKDADLFKITIGDQRFEIPEAIVFGG
jgi:hypothetical protein